MPTIEQQIENLQRVLDVSLRLAATTDLDLLLHTIVETSCQALRCDRATIFLYDATEDELYSRVATGMAAIRFAATRGIAGAAAQSRQVVNVADAYEDPRFNAEIDRQTGYRTRSLLTFPLISHEGGLMGVLQAVNKLEGAFDANDEELARALSAQAGVALHRQHLLNETAKKQQLQRDLRIARDIQQAFLPKENPAAPGYEIAGWNRPADDTGGDCYDFIPLSSGKIALVLADATGHGIGPALVIAEFRALVRAMLSVTNDLPGIVSRVNKLLSADMMDGRFVTTFFGILDPVAHRVDYCSCGQGPILFVRRGAGEWRPATEPPLGVDHGLPPQPAAMFSFEPGDALVLLTDGFYEAMNSRGDLFGEERVLATFSSAEREPLTTVIERLQAAVAEHNASNQTDDLTAVLVRRRP
ncbi:MAG: SpoIIE family protein phosphatase [Phycisphaerales bacterium]|nr:SpoIIE family protein phosphatase [Phycisphaerales bacterium]